MEEFTAMLRDAAAGDAAALSRVTELVYEELRVLARGALRQGRAHETLRTTALVNEAYVKLAGQAGARFQAREQFLAYASRVMRTVLVDYARERAASKRGGDHARLPLEEAMAAFDDAAIDLLDLNQALIELEKVDPELSRLIELRFFAGLTVEQAATELGVSIPTAVRSWRTARAWLRRELSPGD